MLAVLAAGALGGPWSPASAQEGVAFPPDGELLEADLTVTVGPSGTVVETAYRVRPRAGSEGIPLRSLPLHDVRPVGLTARVWEDPVPVELATTPSGMVTARVPLPAPSREGDEVTLRLRYRLRGAAARGAHVRVPLLAVAWPPAEARPGLFTARVSLQGGGRLHDAFPAVWTGEPGGEDPGPGGPTAWRAELPVLPALVSFRVASGPAPVTLPDVLTWGVLGVLGALGAGGGVALRRRAAR